MIVKAYLFLVKEQHLHQNIMRVNLTYIKDVIDNQEYTEIAIAKFSFDELDKKRDEMSLVYAENSPEFIKFIQDYDRLQHQYFLEFKDIIKEYCKSYEEEYRLGNITKKEFDRLNRLKDKYLK